MQLGIDGAVFANLRTLKKWALAKCQQYYVANLSTEGDGGGGQNSVNVVYERPQLL